MKPFVPTVDSVLHEFRAFCEGRLSIADICKYANDLWDWGVREFDDDPNEDESLLWSVASGLTGICLGLHDRDVTDADVSHTRVAVEELIGFLEEGEDAWRAKVRSGWWPW